MLDYGNLMKNSRIITELPATGTCPKTYWMIHMISIVSRDDTCKNTDLSRVEVGFYNPK